MQIIEHITVHGFDTPKTLDVRPSHLHQWHVVENNWSDVGYHYWFDRQGVLHRGRPTSRMGAGVRGHNQNNLHIGLAGGRPDFNYTGKQLAGLRSLIDHYLELYPAARVLGHRDWGETGKTCPGFDVHEWYYKH